MTTGLNEAERPEIAHLLRFQTEENKLKPFDYLRTLKLIFSDSIEYRLETKMFIVKNCYF